MKNPNHSIVEFYREDVNGIEVAIQVEFEITIEWNDYEKDLDQFNILAVSIEGDLIAPSEWSQFEDDVFNHSDAWCPVEICVQ